MGRPLSIEDHTTSGLGNSSGLLNRDHMAEPVVALFEPLADQRAMLELAFRLLAPDLVLNSCGSAHTHEFVAYQLAATPFDVVIWDVSPVTEYECDTLRSVLQKQLFLGLGVVITTTYRARLQRILASDLHSVVVLQKPYAPEDLLECVRKAAAARCSATTSRTDEHSPGCRTSLPSHVPVADMRGTPARGLASVADVGSRSRLLPHFFRHKSSRPP